MADEYWVKLSQGDRQLGAGFVLTRRYVLTALHCLKHMDSDNDSVEIQVAGTAEETFLGHVLERDNDADLAVIENLESQRMPLLAPRADYSICGDLWHGPYRPSMSEPLLDGVIARAAVTYECVGGAFIEALQLTSNQSIGDYSGYSGGPVERVTNSQDPAVVGVLIEQHCDRVDSGRASGTLFAATISEAVRRFACLDSRNLVAIFEPRTEHSAGHFEQEEAALRGRCTDPHASLRNSLAAATIRLESAKSWEAVKLITHETAVMMQLRIVEDILGDDHPELADD